MASRNLVFWYVILGTTLQSNSLKEVLSMHSDFRESCSMKKYLALEVVDGIPHTTVCVAANL